MTGYVYNTSIVANRKSLIGHVQNPDKGLLFAEKMTGDIYSSISCKQGIPDGIHFHNPDRGRLFVELSAKALAP